MIMQLRNCATEKLWRYQVINKETQLKPQVSFEIDSFYCAAQILIVDRNDGAATILMDTVKRLMDQSLHVTTVDDHNEAIIAFEQQYYDLVFIGLEQDRPDNIALAPYFKEARPEIPILIVGQDIHHRTRDRAYEFGADEVLKLPKRASEMKDFIQKVSTQYLLF